ncbi:SGNH/GDSL hydrolase family protein [Microbacterium sp. NPDC077184]|uniref:SGNH/GDSL hydrolase family protein n=1 Tax=Microbacterium sp. NPDC077184 TaxID=3154764 RepID=UPI00341A658D
MRHEDEVWHRRPVWVLTGVAVVLAIVLGLGATAVGTGFFGLFRAVPATSDDTAAEADARIPPRALVVEDGQRMLIFGDSWTFGLGALTRALGYAPRTAAALGAHAVIDGEPGSGYLREGWEGGTYGERIAALPTDAGFDVVIVQGSINDRRRYPEGYDAAVTAAWDALSMTYPDAAFVVLGPAPHVLPVDEAVVAIDRDLAALAAARGWQYISPLSEEWITEENYLSVIDIGPVGLRHPSTDGHAYLAERLVDALRALALPTVVAAETPAPGW